MNIFRLAFELFILYFLYKLIFDFIIPVAKTTSQVKKQFKNMSDQMEQKMNTPHSQEKNTFDKSTAVAPGSKDDYIEFEEVK